ncbi:MAG: alpha/beta hydrolase [Patescibacteria group bacterium]
MKGGCVLLGGWSRDSETYHKIIDTSSPQNHIYTILHTSLIPDIRILQELKTKNLTSVVLIGHSLGDALAISFAANYPECVKKLILVDSEGIPDKRNFSTIVFNWLKDCIFIHGKAKAKENVNALFLIMQNFPYYFAVARFANNVDVRKDAQKIKVPTLILWGEKDKVVPIESAKELNRLIKGSKLVVLDGMDHDWLIHYPRGLWSNIEK